jgi:hypothetical protein
MQTAPQGRRLWWCGATGEPSAIFSPPRCRQQQEHSGRIQQRRHQEGKPAHYVLVAGAEQRRELADRAQVGFRRPSRRCGSWPFRSPVWRGPWSLDRAGRRTRPGTPLSAHHGDRNIARPDANVTGFADSYGSLGGRWLELFKEAIPRLTRVADVFPANAFDNGGEFRATIPAAAAQLGVMIIRMPVRSVVEVEHAISATGRQCDRPVEPKSRSCRETARTIAQGSSRRASAYGASLCSWRSTKTILWGSLALLRSRKRLRTWVGPMAATCGWTFVGAALTSIGYERSRRSWLACNPTSS